MRKAGASVQRGLLVSHTSLELCGSGELEHLLVSFLPQGRWSHLLPHHCSEDGGSATADLGIVS